MKTVPGEDNAEVLLLLFPMLSIACRNRDRTHNQHNQPRTTILA
jgi:hypothetical protein